MSNPDNEIPPSDPPVLVLGGAVLIPILYAMAWIILLNGAEGISGVVWAAMLLLAGLPCVIVSLLLAGLAKSRGAKAPFLMVLGAIVAAVLVVVTAYPSTTAGARANRQTREEHERAEAERRRTWGATGDVYTFLVQPDQKIVVGGVGGIVRLLADGGLDPSFTPLREVTPNVEQQAIALQPDGRILVAMRNRFIRLNPDGSFDAGFQVPPPQSGDSLGQALLVRSDGSILVSGLYTHPSSGKQSVLTRFRPDGSIDESFRAPVDAEAPFRALNSLLPDRAGTILVAGYFRMVGNPNNCSLIRIKANGSLDPSFLPFESDKPLGVQSLRTALYGTRGDFDPLILRIDPNGQTHEDSAMLNQTGPISQMAAIDGGRTLVGGPRGLKRLLANKQLDPSFHPRIHWRDFACLSFALQGKRILVKQEDRQLYRFQADGELDETLLQPTLRVYP